MLKWPPLVRGTLIRRYKRFLADIEINPSALDNETFEILHSIETHKVHRTVKAYKVTAHCPNSGGMLGCSDPGRPVYLSLQNRPERKLKYTWEMIEMPTSLVGTNTMVPNRLVKLSIEAGLIPGLKAYKSVRTEVKYGRNSRIDLFLPHPSKPCFVEIKNCTLVTDGVAAFPDAVTARGLKHLLELQNQARQGKRCVMFYLVQRMDAKVFAPADHIDPAYGQELRKAVKNGVDIMAYDVRMDLDGIRLNRNLPCKLD